MMAGGDPEIGLRARGWHVALRRLKCLLFGHAWDMDAPQARIKPGAWWCARCERHQPAKASEPYSFQHALILRRAGWTADEIDRMGYLFVPASEVLRFVRSAQEQSGALSKDALNGYEEGYIAGVYAGVRMRQS